jgi:hypothetical protein
MPAPISLRARRDFTFKGQVRTTGEVFDETPIHAVILRQHGDVEFTPRNLRGRSWISDQTHRHSMPPLPQTETPNVDPSGEAISEKPKRTYRRRDLVPED